MNWCPALGTVLANEEVTNEGRSDRGNHPVYRRRCKQWMLRITAYAERLLDDLDLVDWPEPIKIMQRNWIGKSEGAEVDFLLESQSATPSGSTVAQTASGRAEDDVIRVYTTRPDTLFGATYMVLAPEHPLVEQITTAGAAGRGQGLRRAGRRASPSSSARPRARRRPASSPARTRSTRSTGRRSRSGSPTT